MHLYDARRRALAFGIAGLAGFVDATGFLAANSYFVSFMSGNTTRFAVDLATEPRQALVPALLLCGFVAGVTLGALVAERYEARRKTAVIGLAAGLLAAAGAARVLGSEAAFLAGAVVAMGAINNAFRRDGEVAIGLTYMTGALVRLGQGLAGWLGGTPREGWLLNLVLWTSLAGGAVAGACVATRAAGLSAWLALSLAIVLWVWAWRIERSGPAA